MSEANQTERAQWIVDAALDRKAEEPVALDVSHVSSFADTFIVLTGRSDRQVRAISDAIAEAWRAHGEKRLGTEGYDEGRWVLMDLDDVIVHIFVSEWREHYDLERLWSEAPALAIELPEERMQESAG